MTPIFSTPTLLAAIVIGCFFLQAPTSAQAQNSEVPYAGPEDGGPRLWEAMAASSPRRQAGSGR